MMLAFCDLQQHSTATPASAMLPALFWIINARVQSHNLFWEGLCGSTLLWHDAHYDRSDICMVVACLLLIHRPICDWYNMYTVYIT